MRIKRNPVPEPNWCKNDYAIISHSDLFSSQRWGKTVKWDLLIEHAKKINNIAHLIDDSVYGSQLFKIYIDILEANIYVFDDLFYYLTGEKITNTTDHDTFFVIVNDIRHRVRFWNMDYCNKINLISEEISQASEWLELTHSHSRVWQLRDELQKKGMKFPPPSYDSSKYHYEHSYAYAAYNETTRNMKDLSNQIADIIDYLDNFVDLFNSLCDPLATEDFFDLLKLFSNSERGKNSVDAWEREFEGSRDSLISKMEKDSSLCPWLHKYLHLRKNEDVISQLFCDEKTKRYINEEECFNTKNWINLLTVAAILQEYDKRQQQKESGVQNKTAKTSPTIVYGDYVVNKNVDNEVNGVAAGATGISVNNKNK